MVFSFLFGGTILVEVTFSLQGIGALLAGSVTFKDIPVVQAITLLTAAVIALATLNRQRVQRHGPSSSPPPGGAMSGAISLARVRRLGLTPVLCAVPLGVVIVCAMASDVLVPDATKQDMALGVVKPGVAGHLLGTDKLGRDIFQMAVAGARSAVVGPVCIALGSMVLGVVLGTMAGYFGGWLDVGLTKYADLLLAMPTTLIALVVAGLVGGGYWVTVAVLMVLFSPTDIRLVRER